MDTSTIAAKLASRGFTVHRAADAAEARAAALALIPDGSSVGVGGSVTVQSLHLTDEIASRGGEVHWHWLVPPEERSSVYPKAAAADVYLLSANAVTGDGRILNIDGNGNRLAASIMGPSTVIFIIGKNKLVDGGFDDALARAKAIACPQNARRLGLNTPCATANRCTDCNSPQRMCKGVLVLERPTSGTTAHVVLVDEDLGY